MLTDKNVALIFARGPARWILRSAIPTRRCPSSDPKRRPPSEGTLHHRLQTRLASPSGLLVLLGRVQFLAEHPSSPVRYRLRGFAQLAADELCHYAVATAMRGIVVHDQIIGVLTDFEKISLETPCRNQSHSTSAPSARLGSSELIV